VTQLLILGALTAFAIFAIAMTTLNHK